MTSARRTSVRARPRILWLTRDLDLVARQLEGGPQSALAQPPDPEELLDAISTDEMTPAWSCYYYDETLARFCLVGLRGGRVQADDVIRGRFGVIASGRSKGCGSSRETAPYSELASGVQIVLARSFEKIYAQNCHNIGLVTSADFGIAARVERGDEIPIGEFTRGLDPLSADVVEHGGLFQYNQARLRGEVTPPPLATPPRPMTLCEKIVATHAVADASTDRVGVAAVAPGDSLFLRADVRFAHEYVTPMAQAQFVAAFGPDARIAEPASVFLFRDHLTFLSDVMTPAHVAMGLREQAAELATVQAAFAARQGVRLFGEIEREGGVIGSEGICHILVADEIGLPGQVVIGTDSHSCTAGALGCLAFGVGSTDMANAWLTRDVRLAVPASVRIELKGKLRAGVAGKDVMLHLLALPYWRGGEGIGQVLEFGGDGVAGLSLDERATLANMAVEAGGMTGIFEADELVVQELVQRRGLDAAAVRSRIVRADPEASYAETFELDLGCIEPMVATPGDPRNGVPLGALRRAVGREIDIAYGGSCTGGKRADMDMYARVLGRALEQGKRVSPRVTLYLQFGSQQIRRYAEQRGYLDLFARVGAKVLEPSCGACIRAGPGVSTREDQVTVAAINRNFPGRSGPGRVYLASPLVVAASAVAGTLAAPDEWSE
jgi:3-isopropylmalate/(R)-2-methylmalate dehydratase large subunit